jgi:tetraacyldisaccharide 4'-kinase
MSLTDTLVSAWSRRGLLAWLLLPFALLFGALSALRRLLYRLGVLKSVRLPRPVIVVGNITVGGAGKTPLTLYLAAELAARGYSPGIVSRGYGGRASEAGAMRQVAATDEAAEVGDEPLLMAQRGICPVWIGRDRAAAGAALLAAHPECDVILCDDGLQHYRLARDVEIVVMDGRGAGNGWLLPSGPLREPLSRLNRVDALVMNGGGAAPSSGAPVFAMHLTGKVFCKLGDPGCTREARDFAGLKLHALAGIGHPQRFFNHLARLNLHPQCHAFPDHHPYVLSDIKNIFGVEVLFMTEKDGVKCAALAPAFAPVDAWILRVEAEPDPALMQHILEKLNGRPPA